MSYQPVPTVRRRRLGSTLRQLRTEAGMTLDAAAAALNAAANGSADARRWTAPKLSRIENANATIRAAEVETLLRAYGVTDPTTRIALEGLAKDAGKRGWWQTYRGVVAPAYADYISLESDAESVRDYTPLVVPGLLQTADYARETIAANAVARTAAEVDALAEVRLARQAVLTRSRHPLRLWAVIHEAALRRRFTGQPGIMAAQLRRLLEVAEWPTVTLQVMPIDAAPNPGDAGAFTLVAFPGPMPDVVTQENLRGPSYVEGVDDVNVFADAFGHIVDCALSTDETKALIAGLV
ncbi:helix-turn-helix domain-containing protein [Streptomyces antimycoticus]|uniref:Helix-turn-helix transcriptional regulator n=2 Tax=Streptomyces violaceusniger group TaxID=2839105 RepID=A0ABD5J247_9ACTN|nr:MULTISPECIES: helix-turn-helix transcriptional regulator [Streptomyces]KUL45104.1 XRE family transcriptional regulator [Streptomyces violaceusniger]MEE4582440.1 helix-turn-helix transcriptional regulator [Streptomyces sp. DSM 41602]WJD99304.1 helix-turn-helix transcriptional regulator [Streptomyces antimycoticus]